MLICYRIIERKDQGALGKLVLGKMALGKMALGKMAGWVKWRRVKWHWVKWNWVNCHVTIFKERESNQLYFFKMF